MGIKFINQENLPRKSVISYVRSMVNEFYESDAYGAEIEIPNDIKPASIRVALSSLRKNGEIPEGVSFFCKNGAYYLVRYNYFAKD